MTAVEIISRTQAGAIAASADRPRALAAAVRDPRTVLTCASGGAVRLSAGTGGAFPPAQNSGYVWERPLTRTADGDAADNTDTGRPFQFFGGWDLTYGTGSSAKLISPRKCTGADTNNPPYSMTFGHAGATKFEIPIKFQGVVGFRLRIDGKWVPGEFGDGGVRYVNNLTVLNDGTTPPSNGLFYTIEVSGLDAGPHVYQLDMIGVASGGVYRAPTAILWKPDPPKITAALLCDSTGGGAGSGQTGLGYTALDCFFDRACDLMGWDGRWNSSVGGSGVTTDGQGTGSSYGDRLTPDISSVQPDVIVLSGSRNDSANSGAGPAVAEAAALTLYQRARDENPQAVIIAEGDWPSVGLPTSSFVNSNTAKRNAALTAGLPFVDMLTGDVLRADGTLITRGAKWMTGSGKVGSTAGDGIADWAIQSDGTHPTQAGAAYRARLAAVAYKAIIDDLAASA